MLEQKGQLFFDTDITGLSKKAIERMTKEKNELLYPIALNHFHSLIPLIKNMGIGDLQWMKMEYTVPYFMDLCFRAKNKLFGIIFGQEQEENNIYFPLDLDISIKKCEENDIIPCVMVFDKELNIIPYTEDKWCLLDAKSLFINQEIEAIIPDEIQYDKTFKAMSKWEEINTAVMAYVEDLRDKQGITELLYQTYPGVDPAICWVDKKNRFNWMMLDTMKEYEKEPNINSYAFSKLRLTGGIGHVAIALLTNPNTNGVLPRGEKVDIKMEVEDFS